MLDASAVWRCAAPVMARCRPSWVVSNSSILGVGPPVESSVPGLFRAPVHGCWTGHRRLGEFLEALWARCCGAAAANAPGFSAYGRTEGERCRGRRRVGRLPEDCPPENAPLGGDAENGCQGETIRITPATAAVQPSFDAQSAPARGTAGARAGRP